jgi:hypothetical protein
LRSFFFCEGLPMATGLRRRIIIHG